MIRKAWWSSLLLLIVLLSSGCGGAFSVEGQEPDPNAPPPPPPPPKGHDRVFRLDEPLDYSLADLLKKPRRELAALGDEWLERVRIQQQRLRSGDLELHLMPGLRLPLVVPVFRQAKYSEKVKLSLPPYLEEGKKDNAVALHLARFGDVDGALQLADPTDPKVPKLIKTFAGAKNYPAEWTRLVALQLHVAQVRLATGEPEGARLVIGLHRQLKDVLDPRAQESQLGAVLLSRGHAALIAADAAWRKESQADPTKLADQADAALADWGKYPQVRPFIPWGSKRVDLARFLDSAGTGYALAPRHPERAFDIFALPFLEAEVEGVVAGFDGSDQFVDLLVLYRASVAKDYSRPAQLAQLCEESSVPGTDVPPLPGLIQRSYQFGPKTYIAKVTLVPLHTEIGALVQISPGIIGGKELVFGGGSMEAPEVQFSPGIVPGKVPALPRQLGDVDFDLSFESNRLRLALNQQGLSIKALPPKNFGPLGELTKVLPCTRVILERDPEHNVLDRLTLQFAESPQGLLDLAPLIKPLLSLGGPARVSAGEGDNGRYLAFSWSDGHTAYTLRLLQGRDRPPELEVVDLTPGQEKAGRAQRVAAADRARREARLKEGKPQAFIKRTWEQVRLGMTRREVKDMLPTGKGIKQRAIPDGIGIIFNEIPEEHPGYIPRELFVRFGTDQRVAEVRVRYTNGPGSNNLGQLLGEIRKTSGAPWQLPGPWAQVWKGFPRRAPAPVLYRWQDDLSVLTCQVDSEGLELAARDCSLAEVDGVRLPAFQCLPAGLENCRLGDSREDLLRRWKDSGPDSQKEVLILSPRNGSYDALMVSFAGNRVVRILARHRRQGQTNPSREELAKAVREAWGERLADFGFPRREDTNARKEMQTWTNHDELTRLSVFWQENRSGAAHVYTEWVALADR